MGLLDEFQSMLSGSGQTSQAGGNAGFPGGLQSIFGGSSQMAPASGKSGGLGDVLGPGLLGGLIGAFLPGRGGLLRTGGASALAAMLWNKYKDRLRPPQAGTEPAPMAAVTDQTGAPAETDPAAVRLIRAMVFAAKSDGQIDQTEQAAINQRLKQLGGGPMTEQIVNQAVNEPLDPNLVAAGVSGPQEAMALFLASCSVIQLDHFMENSYLDALATALGLPPEMKKDIEAEAHKAA